MTLPDASQETSGVTTHAGTLTADAERAILQLLLRLFLFRQYRRARGVVRRLLDTTRAGTNYDESTGICLNSYDVKFEQTYDVNSALNRYPWLEREDVLACLEYARRLVGH